MKKKQNNRPAITRGNLDNTPWVKWLKTAPPVKSNNVKGSLALDMSVVEWSMLTAIASRRGLAVDTTARDLLVRNLAENFDRLQ